MIAFAGNLPPRPVLAMALLCAALSAAALLEVLAPVAEDRAGVAPSAPPAVAEPAKQARVLPGLGEFSDIARQTVFRPTRRPPDPVAQKAPSAPVPVVAPALPKPLPAMTLLGIVVMPQRQTALIQIGGASKAMLIGQGDNVEGWSVAEIGGNRIVLRSGDEAHEILFPKQGNSAPPSSPSFGSLKRGQ